MLIIEGMTEEKQAEAIDRQAEVYDKKYGGYFNDLRSAKMFSTSSRKFEAYDAYCLGTQLEQYKMMEKHMRENGSIADLGVLPNIALDVIAGSYGNGVHNLLASNQPIGEINGTVYFKNLVFTKTRGGIDPTVDDRFISGQEAGSYANMGKIDKYADSTVNAVPAQTASTVVAYSFNLSEVPVTVGSAKIEISEVNVLLIDDKTGNLTGLGGSGTIDYATGAVAITLDADPGATPYDIKTQYDQNFELIDNPNDLPQTMMEMTSTQVEAKIAVLSQKIGVLQSFSYNKRFGRVLEDDLVNDLIQGISAVASTKTINALIAAWTSTGNAALTFAKAKPATTNTSEREYRKDLALVISQAEGNLNRSAGRGTVNRITAGSTACNFLSQQDGFVNSTVNNIQGPHVFGSLNGIVIVRAPQIAVDDMYLSYISEVSPFEAPVVRGVYMPLYMTGLLDNVTGLFKNKTVAEWAAYAPVVPQFVQKITLI